MILHKVQLPSGRKIAMEADSDADSELISLGLRAFGGAFDIINKCPTEAMRRAYLLKFVGSVIFAAESTARGSLLSEKLDTTTSKHVIDDLLKSLNK